MPNLVTRAKEFAIAKHDSNPIVERRFRKYTKEPYWSHPARVATILEMVAAKPEVIAAAWLHDLVEDCPVTTEEIEALFGRKVARLVAEVTNPSKLIDGSRAVRKAIDHEHLKKASPEGMSIKLADIVDNTPSIVKHAPEFARKKYLPEMRALLPFLGFGDPLLFEMATRVLTTDNIKKLE